MRFKALAGLLGIVSASYLWASHGKPWEMLSSFRSHETLSSSEREVYREQERLRRSDSPLARAHPGMGRADRFVYRDNLFRGSDLQAVGVSAVPTLSEDGRLTHATIPLCETPPTVQRCRHVETASPTDSRFRAAFQTHKQTVKEFVRRSGFGFERVIQIRGDYDRDLPLSSESVERAELVSLLVHEDPSIYQFKSANDPSQPHVQRRPLDPFEELALDHLRRGANLVWTREQPDRMVGAIRATSDCLSCHSNAKENELLGAFSYRLKSPVPRIDEMLNSRAGLVQKPMR
jgi:hypothetical protein